MSILKVFVSIANPKFYTKIALFKYGYGKHFLSAKAGTIPAKIGPYQS